MKRLFFIQSQKLIKERTDSALLNLSTTKPFKQANNVAKKPSKDNCVLNIYSNSINNHTTNTNHHNLINFINLPKKEADCTAKTHSKRDIQLQKLLKIVKQNYNKLDEERLKHKNVQDVMVEWRELARKLDLVFLVISSVIIVVSPVVLFGRFLVRDITKDSSHCGCERPFI